jgi:outer membrane murein-binding lipoprotein Lpp
MSKMIITSLELVNYTRMSLAGIKRFVFMPDDAYALQTILGTNGSGKSSLLWELWPLPPDKEQFGVGGKKDLKITYNGKYYELISTFEGNKPKHEFIVDGIELNDGFKVEMFKALCEEHFQVTTELRTLVLGDTDQLTKMSPARRRYWMIKLADTDFTYAMMAYKKLQENHRDATGMIKRLQKRQVDETNKLVDKDVVLQMKEETSEIKKLITEIYGMRNAHATKPADVLSEMEAVRVLLDASCSEVERLNNSMLESCGFDNREQMVEARESVKILIHSTQQLSQHLFTDHTRIRKKYDMMVKAGSESIGQLEKKVKDAQDQIAFKMQYIAMNNVVVPSDAVQARQALLEIHGELNERLSSLQKNDGEWTPPKAQEAEEKIMAISAQVHQLQARMARLVEDIDHRRNHVQADSLTCPNCKHSWTTKASEEDLKKADAVVLQMKEKLEELATQKEATKKWLVECQEWAANYRAVVSIMRSAPVLSSYFNYICQNDRLKLYPSSVVHDVHTVMSDLEHHIEIQALGKVITQALEQITLKENMDSESLESIEKDLKRIEETMGIQTQKLQTLNAESTRLDNLISAYDRNAKLNEQLLTNVHMQTKHAKDYIYSRYQELLWYLIMSLQTQLARKEDALNAAIQQQSIVDEIIRQLEEAHMNERIAKAAHIALSPTNGAIAEGLHRFINVFLTKMNKVINSVWSYPLELLPFTMEDGTADMDYKFPFMRNRDGKPAKDVVEGSKSMLGIFNFAFRMCALRQLGLGHLPLFLDEIEEGFDDGHRQAAIYFVKKLIDEQAFGQIFMVSHYESNHGALTSLAQTCVLSKDNLLLPTDVKFNQHVIIN